MWSKMRGEEGISGVSANEYSCTQGAQISFYDLTPYLTYVFSPCYSQSPLLTDITLTPCKSGLKLVCNVNIVNGNQKSEHSQDYAQKPPQRNCALHEFGFQMWQRALRAGKVFSCWKFWIYSLYIYYLAISLSPLALLLFSYKICASEAPPNTYCTIHTRKFYIHTE